MALRGTRFVLCRPLSQRLLILTSTSPAQNRMLLQSRSFSHLVYKQTHAQNLHMKFLRQSSAITVLARYESTTGEAAKVTLPEGYIPEPPSPLPDVVTSDDMAASVLDPLVEPALKTLGLCANTPPGLYQSALEWMHLSLDFPWWAAIIASTLVIRVCLLPIVIKGQRNAVAMSNHMPTINKLQADITKARAANDVHEVYRLTRELNSYCERNNFKPLRSLMLPLTQAPIFVSVYYGIRGMANLPVESMTRGGLLWFTDLTIPDPFYALPILTSLTLLVTLEAGVDGQKASTMTPTLRTIMRLIPLFILPFTTGCPTAMLCYWMTSNVVSLVQVLVLRMPGMRARLNIPDYTPHDKAAFKRKGFVQGVKESYSNSRLIAEIEKRQSADALRFKEAGMSPIEKTYSYNPKKVKAASRSGHKKS